MSQAIFPNINPTSTSGDDLATILNGFKDAVASGFSGTSRPPNLQAGGYWIDTSLAATPNFLLTYKLYTGTADVAVFSVNTSTGLAGVVGALVDFDITKASDDAVGAVLNFFKERIAGTGATQVGDDLGVINFYTNDDTGSPIVSARVRAVSANATTSSQAGAYLVFEEINTGTGALTEKARLIDGKWAVGTTSPSTTSHIKGSGHTVENESNTTTGALTARKKRRTAGGGQVLTGDSIGTDTWNSTDSAGADLASVFEIDVVATEDHTSVAQGTRADIKVKKTGSSTKTTMVKIGDILEFPEGQKTKNAVIGSHATANTNAKFNRSAAGELQLVLGGDTTAEGSKATVLGSLGFKAESFTSGTKPAAGNSGRLIWVSDLNRPEFDNGTAWIAVSGSGASQVVRWKDGVNPAFPSEDSTLNAIRSFQAGQTQSLICAVKVPNGYSSGTPIKLIGEFYSPDSSGTVLLRTVSTLIRQGTDAITSTTNQRTSTNSAVTQSGGLVNVPQKVEWDITSTSGQINGVNVSANDLIIVSLSRGTDTATSDVALLSETTELYIA